MSELLREVDEVMQQERMARLWDENKVYIIGFIVGTILLTAGLSGYRSWNNARMETQSVALIEMQEAESYPQNVLDNAESGLRPELEVVSLLNAAAAFMEEDQMDQAVIAYERAAAVEKAPVALRHVGALMAVRLLMGKPDQNGEALLQKLAPVLNDTHSPWHAHARLEAAIIRGDKLGDFAAAVKHLDVVQNNEFVPQSLRDRASSLKHIHSLKK